MEIMLLVLILVNHGEVNSSLFVSGKWSHRLSLRIFISSLSRLVRAASSSGKDCYRLHLVAPFTIFPWVIVVVVIWQYWTILNFKNKVLATPNTTPNQTIAMPKLPCINNWILFTIQRFMMVFHTMTLILAQNFTNINCISW